MNLSDILIALGIKDPDKLVKVRKVYYHKLGYRYIITLRSLLDQDVSVDSEFYLTEEAAVHLHQELTKAMKHKEE